MQTEEDLGPRRYLLVHGRRRVKVQEDITVFAPHRAFEGCRLTTLWQIDFAYRLTARGGGSTERTHLGWQLHYAPRTPLHWVAIGLGLFLPWFIVRSQAPDRQQARMAAFKERAEQDAREAKALRA